ncbi:hypothetical protein [Chitinophaga eiseniae]|uniref:Uncharacterized protein n=1 Tax=Chitinophaga eiseniae TaxID=634771 RepID=A0A847SVQ0_9BACT|nr:hypothetical protein [Chitinophaga eiseniae]NLR82256.1 hypothetical protein [Chitinophaga eiseniae]
MSIVKKRFDVQVTTEGQLITQTFELDKNITTIKGILLTSNADDLLYYRGSQRIEINKYEVVPDNYESKLLMSGINLSPNQRWYEVGDLPAGNGQVKITFTDRIDTRFTFDTYRVSLYLNCVQQD